MQSFSNSQSNLKVAPHLLLLYHLFRKTYVPDATSHLLHHEQAQSTRREPKNHAEESYGEYPLHKSLQSALKEKNDARVSNFVCSMPRRLELVVVVVEEGDIRLEVFSGPYRHGEGCRSQ
jgi:hypothetical protein